MKVISDFHIHSRFSRATSKQLDVRNLVRYAKIKGLNLLGTGDFTHAEWLKELKEQLEEDGSGFLQDNSTGFPFILTGEVSSIYKDGGKVRRIHNILLTPSIETAEQINEAFEKKGVNLKSDGRPICGINCPELVETIKSVDKRNELIPAHCCPPSEKLFCIDGIKNICDVRIGDTIITHKNRWKMVTKTYKRKYQGKLIKIKPFYFRIGTKATPEHPFFAITKKNCPSTGGFCKSACGSSNTCARKFYKNYKPEWVQAKDLRNSDILVFPRFNKKNKDVNHINVSSITKFKLPKTRIQINKDFCRLLGYFLAEGYTNSRDAIMFCLSGNDAIEDVKTIVSELLGINRFKERIRPEYKGTEIIIYSKALVDIFKQLCYSNKRRTSIDKSLNQSFLWLPQSKQVEILKGWWYGDRGYSTSENLINQMKIICLRLGIIPSIRVYSKEEHAKRIHRIGKREIKANHDLFHVNNLSFFRDEYELLKSAMFKKFSTKIGRRHGWIDDEYVYIPIRDIEDIEYDDFVYNLEVDGDNSYTTLNSCVHNCWTPWFSLFGSMSGFDTIEECFKDQTKHIFALETGLSSDPAMNWRLSMLDKYALVSNSDSHSFWPWRIGREANVFEMEKLTYDEFIKIIKEKDPKRFLYTIEVDPSYGKYHFDGHRACDVCMEPKDSVKARNICPKCGRKLTIGVLHRVEELADRPEGFQPNNAIPFKSLIPLSEIISSMTGVNQLYSKKVWEHHTKLINAFGTEFNVLLDAPLEKITEIVGEKMAKAIVGVREGKIKMQPGYDGVYGYPVFAGGTQKIGPAPRSTAEKMQTNRQKSLSDFSA